MKPLFLRLLLLLPLLARGQESRVIRGRLLSAGTNQPIQFATLSVADGQLSITTNTEGYFMLSLPDSYDNDTLTLTALGHSSILIPVSRLAPTDSIIQLPPNQRSTEIYFDTALPFATRDTLLKAVAAISRNYSQQPTLLHGFYRESIRDESSNVPAMEA